MSYLHWELDYENGLDAYDPLGEIQIVGEQGKVEEQSTYLDAFLEALVEGVTTMREGFTNEIDTIVEPDYLVITCETNQIDLSYGSQSTIIFDKSRFVLELRSSIKKFLELMDELLEKDGKKRRQLLKLREFVDHYQLH